MIKSITISLLTVTTFQMFNAVTEFQSTFPQPVSISSNTPINEDRNLTRTREALKLLNAPPDKLVKLTKACYSAGFATDIDPVLIACIIPQESEFNIKAKSKLGYKSLMQTKDAYVTWEYAEANIMAGACTLRGKIASAKGNVEKGMIYYKGHGGKESQDIAAKQMKLYRSVKLKVNEIMKG